MYEIFCLHPETCLEVHGLLCNLFIISYCECHRQNLVFQLRDIPFCYWQKDKNNKAKYSFQPNAL